ncbi:hypothetical protein SAMN06264364_11157 [Quadrisphaera granulorum]|uniref:Uncharacterized protein n=1 Tax=Quadrisphaera granulorum TaxID=317664 RepID=A0A316A9V9_9ACTN|nr:hypothetical protein [Quadrisphaera granulorum]PWJ53654.1 hypothetical protein BXY45_11157 [Quadrisphaera granulorum]SZE96698.1 hypothetical protein SAMN06264364_11157 [Quadrisphaera granulorum]
MIYGMPGLWLLALLVGAGLAAVLLWLGRTQREARTEVARGRRTGRMPQPR